MQTIQFQCRVTTEKAFSSLEKELFKFLDLPNSLCSELTKFTKLMKPPVPHF